MKLPLTAAQYASGALDSSKYTIPAGGYRFVLREFIEAAYDAGLEAAKQTEQSKDEHKPCLAAGVHSQRACPCKDTCECHPSADTFQAESDTPFEHDDYTRMIAYVTPDLSLQETDLWKTAIDVRRRGYQALHRLRFGCLPTECANCKDDEGVMRALNCDENGNPNGG